MFESKADYKVLKEVFANESKTLTEDQYSKNINKLKELAGERSAFNQERHKPRKLKARIYHDKKQFNQFPDMESMGIKPVEVSNEMFDKLTNVSNKPEKSTNIEAIKSNIQAVKSTFSINNSNESLSSPTVSTNSGNLESLESQVIELDNQAAGLNAKLNQAKTETEKSSIRQKLAGLLHKKTMLNIKIQMEKIIAASRSSQNKPRCP